MKICVAYWSGTGNTGAMAQAVAEGVKAAGGEAVLAEAGKVKPDEILAADGIALGCPAMGAEILEEEAMEPLVTELAAKGTGDKPVGLFGSYDWGDGQWMRDWSQRMKAAGSKLIAEGVIAQLAPDAAALEACAALGKKLAGA
ncbi:MAG: flavodoxin [Spirochaetales bacterium]|jgi:flavodoxin short chain|nr:flavodoxin [Spirochaetales bacterium]